ncbi:ABC transporter ATP-binding protein [Peribacillus deserti]|uniref:Multidrug ABC transporter ATP-binding protein n=1 Tax=Peribacillus deserti TaxID=673318 RepID=A0A2N5M8T3_9BACI|nr:ABC transporter ATP-binding protein [Peribacillus deserti]PLT30713.1 multidrug ABC transporter ATP-binding protein [Peribacillus deserti]
MLKDLISPFRYKPILDNGGIQKGTLPQKNKPKAKNQQQTLNRLWKYLAVYRLHLNLVIAMVIISSVLSLLGPFLAGKAIDHYIVTRDSDGILTLLAGLAIIYLFTSITLFLQNYWMIGIAQNTVSKMRNDLFNHLHKLPIPFFDKRQHGELMSRVTNDIENVSSTLNSSVIQVISSILILIGTISVMLYLSPLLTVLTLIIIPLMFTGMKWITNRTGRLFKIQQRNLGELNGFIEETISGQRIVKTFSQEKKVINEFINKNDQLKGAGFWASAYSGFIPKLMNGLNNLSFTVIAAIGGWLAYKGHISIGTIVIFAEYSRQFTRPLNDLANQFNTVLSAIAGAERVFDILNEQEESKDEHNTTNLFYVDGSVEFCGVSFSYEKEGNTISDISFSVTPGETVALVGATGAGKTTIINLISRFYDADSGSILIDGKEIKRIKREELRKHMGFVLQDSYLFQGTIRENIRYGRLEATDDEVERAAELANAHSFIMKLPEQYETVLKQDGSGISQGQKQLLSIARAILADPSILILDEATSSIDTITELKIQDALQRLMEGRTSFVVAHRLNTIQKADQIIVLSEGQIIERGSHQELLSRKGYYFGLFNSQLQKI